MRAVLLAVATGGTGLVAGVFLAFTIAVVPALGASDARTFVATMNRINVAIVNPVFMLLLFGAPVIFAVAALLGGPRRGWVILALVLNLAALVITMVVNVPLNNALAAADLADPAAARSAFENAWNAAHTVRTVLLAGSLAASIVALAGAAERV
jgi:uncharacterized membrane protein